MNRTLPVFYPLRLYPGLQPKGAKNSGSVWPGNFAIGDRKLTRRSSTQAASPGSLVLLVINGDQQYLVIYNARLVEPASLFTNNQ